MTGETINNTPLSVIPLSVFEEGYNLEYDDVLPALQCQDMQTIEDLESFISEKGVNCVDALNSIAMNGEIVNGMYRRCLIIPKGTFVTGKIHREEYFDMVIAGDVSVQVPDGIERYTGFTLLKGIPGRKRVLYAHEDTLWVTVDRTDAMEKDKAEEDITFNTFAEYDDFVREALREAV